MGNPLTEPVELRIARDLTAGRLVDEARKLCREGAYPSLSAVSDRLPDLEWSVVLDIGTELCRAGHWPTITNRRP